MTSFYFAIIYRNIRLSISAYLSECPAGRRQFFPPLYSPYPSILEIDFAVYLHSRGLADAAPIGVSVSSRRGAATKPVARHSLI